MCIRDRYIAGITYEYYSGMEMATVIKEIVKVDDYTVKFVLTRPEAPFIANLGMDFASIMSKEYADALEAAGTKENLNSAPIGTGPFQFVAYEKDAVIRFKSNPDYWGGKQAIDDLVFAITVDPAVRMQKLLAGECQVAPYPAPADLAALKANPDMTVMEQGGLNVAHLGSNTTVAPFDKPEVPKGPKKESKKKAINAAGYQS